MDKNMVLRELGGYVNTLLEHSDAEHPSWNKEVELSGKENRWNYIDGCMISAVLSLYEMTREKRYLDFADSFIGWFVNEDGSIKRYDLEEYNLDNINAGKALFPLYDLTGSVKYRRAMDTVYKQVKASPRTREGNFWHKKIYPNQVWLDGLYMAQPFYVEYERRYCDKAGCIDSFRQFQNVRRRMRDEKTGLYYHGYDESRAMYWASPETGCSPNFWLRALGWFTAALVDTAEKMDEQLYYEYRSLQEQLFELVKALLPYQHQSGMFYQVIDKPEEKGNYLETSGTALISYAIMKAARLGFIPKSYAAYGEKAFWGTVERYLSCGESGEISLGGICLVAGLGGKQRRDGSLGYYFSEPVVKNEAKGVAPLLMAYTELLRMQCDEKA